MRNLTISPKIKKALLIAAASLWFLLFFLLLALVLLAVIYQINIIIFQIPMAVFYLWSLVSAFLFLFALHKNFSTLPLKILGWLGLGVFIPIAAVKLLGLALFTFWLYYFRHIGMLIIWIIFSVFLLAALCRAKMSAKKFLTVAVALLILCQLLIIPVWNDLSFLFYYDAVATYSSPQKPIPLW